MEREKKNTVLTKNTKDLQRKLARYRSLIVETRRENDDLFSKIKEFIVNGDFSDSD